MCIVDMNQVAYRPLVGNGVNRDTQIETNVQSADEDLRKDIILTEAGLEVTLPEAHALYNLEQWIGEIKHEISILRREQWLYRWSLKKS